MALITLLNAQLAFGHVALLDHTDIAIESAERVGLIGRNGAGKSSLLKILGGMEKPDDGTCNSSRACASPMWPRSRAGPGRYSFHSGAQAWRGFRP
jgi:ATPase subunit of ABC transporter with duplicated ATPase domains